ncbi:hypothetical protein COEREDRAFT_82808 [Coemansia reversa NRRL 1564]|uniref:Uncharacterized protein n=1 Tax=Coemansia reversa (strain ATCC 12441 / NRRL 1564) TaxID=763665 RepID=A0A2G5B5K6_COERN|nr:hypothetical protein COEREDRAFT_82808 [Coemansia reversa NRRL 1564]|eukprot:PIA14281.1 hypothetical protein COEREDRAFT_82808 [Coemansia reversa NRRL 1564]
MKETVSAVQDLMRDTARFFDQARKINEQLLQIDTFVNKRETGLLLEGLDQCRRQYKQSLSRARNIVLAHKVCDLDGVAGSSETGDDINDLHWEREHLRKEAVAKSEEIRRLLDCMRQIQLTSAQLMQM